MTHTLDTSKLGEISESPVGPILQGAAGLLARMVAECSFPELHPFFPQQAQVDDKWYVVYRHDAPDGSCSLQVFVWPPDSKTNIHDHSSWGVFCCVIGSVLEERYERLANRSKPGYARLRKLWQRTWSREEGISTVLPRDRGIHRLSNPGDSTAISVHIYGPRIDEVDGRDYEPSRDYVCDRRDD